MAESNDSSIRCLLCERLNSVNFWKLQGILGGYGWWQLIFLELRLIPQQPSPHLREWLLSTCPPQEAPFLLVLLSCLSRRCYLPLLSRRHKRGFVAIDNRRRLFRKGRFIGQRDSIAHWDVARAGRSSAGCEGRCCQIRPWSLLVIWICCLQKIAMVSA